MVKVLNGNMRMVVNKGFPVKQYLYDVNVRQPMVMSPTDFLELMWYIAKFFLSKIRTV